MKKYSIYVQKKTGEIVQLIGTREELGLTARQIKRGSGFINLDGEKLKWNMTGKFKAPAKSTTSAYRAQQRLKWRNSKTPKELYAINTTSRSNKRAKLKDIPHSITVENVLELCVDYCPYLNIPINYSNGKIKNNSPSLDRIIPELGYIPENIQVISKLANVMKNNATEDELITFAMNVLDIHKK